MIHKNEMINQETAKRKNTIKKNPDVRMNTLRMTTTALFMALTVVLSSFSIPVPGGHLYLCDVTISLAAILLNPFEAFLVGGLGSFLGDLFFYPVTMLISLVTHGLQAVVISVFSHKVMKNRPQLASGIGVTLGGIIMVTGYTLGKIFIYSTVEYAMMKLPYEILQGAVGAVGGMVLCWNCRIRNIFHKMIVYRE